MIAPKILAPPSICERVLTKDPLRPSSILTRNWRPLISARKSNRKSFHRSGLLPWLETCPRLSSFPTARRSPFPQDVGGLLGRTRVFGIHILEDQRLSFPGGTPEVSGDLVCSFLEVGRVFLDEKLHHHFPCIVFNFPLVIAETVTGVFDLRWLNGGTPRIELGEVVVR